MPPSASKQKRLAEKAAKKNAGGGPTETDSLTTSTTPTGSVSGASTPLTSVGEDLQVMSMARLNIATDRSAAGVLVSDVKSRDIKLDSYTLSFH
jgi:ATP-binding cassette subfamily F protein 2